MQSRLRHSGGLANRIGANNPFNWDAWWASLVSATVEQAAPTHVVLTFPTAQPSLGASDFTIAGFTINSASWAGAVLTLVLAETVALGDILVVTFVVTGGTHAVTNNVTHPLIIEDGNTVAWYKHDDLRTVFRDGANRVNHWLDRMNYAIGADLVAGWDFTAGWAAVGGAVIDDADTFHCVGAGGIRTAAYPLVLNTTYRLRARWRLNLAATLRLYDFGAVNIQYTYTGTGAYEDIDICFTVTAMAGAGICLWLVNAGTQIDVDYMIIEPIAGNHLLQNTAAWQPLYSMADGLLFDGVNDCMQTLPFVWNQPAFIYFVGRQITWTFTDRFFDALPGGTMQLLQNAISPELSAFTTIMSAVNNNLPLNTFGIIRYLSIIGNCFFEINQTGQTVWVGGATNPGGFTLGAASNTTLEGNIEAKEVILRNVADGAGVQAEIYNYLRNANGCG